MSKLLVIVPIWNKEQFLEKTIEGILQQTFTNFELVLVDDYSEDNSFQIAKSYEHLDNVTVLQNSENRGCYYSRNKGLEYFKDKEWDYFTIHDADDVSDVKRFQHFINIFKSHSEIVGIKSTSIEYDFKTDEPLIKENQYSIFTGEGTAFYRREVFNELGYFDNTRFSGDTDYMWRLEALCVVKKPEWKIGISQEILYINYSHENNITKLYDWNVTRPRYWQKIKEEIQNKMIPTGNFYRQIFK
jgi:glycosyltransferase involved in cell wall biosynthesis